MLRYAIVGAIFEIQSSLCNLCDAISVVQSLGVSHFLAAVTGCDIHEKLHSEFEEKVACSVAMLCR